MGRDPFLFSYFERGSIHVLTHTHSVSSSYASNHPKEKPKKERKFDLHTITPLINTTSVVKVYMKEQERNTNQNTYINYFRDRKTYLNTHTHVFQLVLVRLCMLSNPKKLSRVFGYKSNL